ncbi:MAG: PRC-barrel domain-containing protein [Gaiellaceae bacterium]
MSDPVSWLLIEKGWRVYASDGSELGKVVDIDGDENADIFDGLAVDAGFLDKPRYVPGEVVAEIERDHVALRLTREKFEHLDVYKAPAESIEIESEQSSRSQRLIGPLQGLFRGRRRR